MKDIDVLNHLLADASIVAIVGDNAWAAWLPEKADMPALTCNYVSDVPINTLTGDTLKSREIISINCWANDKQTAVNLLNAVKARMDGFAVRNNTTDLSELEQGIYRYSIDYSKFG